MIRKIVDAVEGCRTAMKDHGYNVELLVNVDDPSDHETWANLAANSSDFIIPVFSSNINEIRAVNRWGDAFLNLNSSQ